MARRSRVQPRRALPGFTPGARRRRCLLDHHVLLTVDPMQLHDILCGIHANSNDLIHNLLLSDTQALSCWHSATRPSSGRSLPIPFPQTPPMRAMRPASASSRSLWSPPLNSRNCAPQRNPPALPEKNRVGDLRRDFQHDFPGAIRCVPQISNWHNYVNCNHGLLLSNDIKSSGPKD